jgi:hypothetical protein
MSLPNLQADALEPMRNSAQTMRGSPPDDVPSSEFLRFFGPENLANPALVERLGEIENLFLGEEQPAK